MDRQVPITALDEKSSSHPLAGRRPTKFTLEAVRQIRNFVESGKSREEIAEIIGASIGSLQVTCSRLGISLRRGASATAAPVKQAQAALPHQGHISVDASVAKFAMSMQYNGYERVLALPFTNDIIGQLALEAAFRNMSIGKLLAELITAIARRNLVRQVLQGDPNPDSPAALEAACTFGRPPPPGPVIPEAGADTASCRKNDTLRTGFLR
jgi:hypothetical protein